MYHGRIGVDCYVFDDDKSIRSGFKAIRLKLMPLFANFRHSGGKNWHFLPLRVML